jgi:hypothetical protein
MFHREMSKSVRGATLSIGLAMFAAPAFAGLSTSLVNPNLDSPDLVEQVADTEQFCSDGG